MSVSKLALLCQNMLHLILWVFLRRRQRKSRKNKTTLLFKRVKFWVQYAEKDKIRISRYDCFQGNRGAATNFVEEYQKLDESCFQRWAAKYNSPLIQQPTQKDIVIGANCGRPTLLSCELDAKFPLSKT